MNIYKLGFYDFYSENLNIDEIDLLVGRVIRVDKENYRISDGENEYNGKLTGNLIYSSDVPEDFPVTGDFVLYQNFENDSLAIIHKILKRKSLLKRKAAGKKVEFQPIAANIDFGIIMQSLNNDFNISRLERYMVMLGQFKIDPILIFSKADLFDFDGLESIKIKIRNAYPDVETFFFSNFKEEDIKMIVTFLNPGKTYCLIGSSGVGKSTLINNLIGEEILETKNVRESDGRGRHTTTNRQLHILSNGAMIIDNPGMRELANISVNEGIDNVFDEISDLAEKCRFNDCSHTVEKGCAILDALEEGTIDKKRYNNFLKIRKESAHFERSYLERRRRDKEFGKMVKSILKHKKKK